ncbi:outer membrane usher protein [Acinetobacter calcoaceticus]|uniref:Outer membrane usher protein n=1 Tax=Acinetobacter calcoaceticus TaxID=471 RepID=A0A4R1XPT6_ACICA|nr:outer membrane usher protein [Acinetobacter calcoaceticus]
MMVCTVAPRISFAEQVFNTAFLSDGLGDSKVSDLSKFENSTHQLAGIYRVDLFANDQHIKTSDINFIERKGVDERSGLLPCFTIQNLEEFGVNIHQYPELSTSVNQQCLDFPNIIEGASSQFQFDKQKLTISLPQISLKNQIRGYIPPEQWDAGINGLFLNYNLSGNNNSKSNSNSVFLGLENGFNLGMWQFRHFSSFNYNSQLGTSTQDWNNLNTYVQKTIIPLKSNLLIGDGSANGEIFDSYSFRGVQLSTADAMFPDSQQGYAPTVRGSAKTNAKVVIRQNGFVIHQVNVAPGPFLIEDLNPGSYSGDLKVSIEENDGSIQSYTVPYSSLPIFQREGRTKYNVIVGEFRSGLKSQGNPNIVQATATHGFSKGITLYTGTQLSKDYQSALLGLGSNLGQYGAFSFDITHSKSELADQSSHEGQSIRFLYSKSLLSGGTTFQLLGYRYSTKGFYTLNDVAYNSMQGYNQYQTQDENTTDTDVIKDYYNLNNARKGRFEVNLSHSFGKYGSVFISGNQQTYWGTTKSNEWVQAGYSNAWNGFNYTLTASRNRYSQTDRSDIMFSANLSFALDKLRPSANYNQSPLRNTYTNFSTTQNSEGHNTYMAGLSGTLLKDRNLSYSINQGYISDQQNIGSMSLNYRGTYGTIGAGYSYESDSNQFTYNASGGILAHRDGITFGQSINGTSILIKAPGAIGVGVENITGVKTDWRGYAIVPFATDYRMNRIALDSNTFSNNLEIRNNVATVVPIRGAIVRATFDTSVGVRALATIRHNGQYAPYASQVTETHSLSTGMIADDGRAYLTGLPLKGHLKIQWGSQATEQCTAKYDISDLDLTKSVVQFNLECE